MMAPPQKLSILALLACLAMPFAAVAESSRPSSFNLSAIDRVWSGHPVDFALVTTDQKIYVAYYDSNRQLTIASRPRASQAWVFHKLDIWTGWDSHNYIALAVDDRGQVHVAANMHNDPLVYYRTTSFGEVRTMQRVPNMVDPALERSITYPIFLKNAEGRLVYKYRDGISGRGNEIYNVYDSAAQSWSHLLTSPLVDGEGQRNAYFVGPVMGPDGWFHLTWVWRDTPLAETNHDLSYARSRDLVHWTRSDGTPLNLPIKLGSAEIVDPVPIKGGMINDNTLIGFDRTGRVMITYHKFDQKGQTQIYVTRRDDDKWTVAQASDWKDFRWDFEGRGSSVFRLLVNGVEPIDADLLRVPLVRDGKPIDLILDARTLTRVEERPGRKLANELMGLKDIPGGMQLNTVEEPARGSDSPLLALAWPTLPANRDVPAGDIPNPTTLWLVTTSGAAQ
jgi:hypothetical protein